MESGAVVVVELQRNSNKFAEIIEEIVKMKKKIFPEHESVARSFDEELRKNNSGLLYTMDAHGELVGYVMYIWPSSLSAFIAELAVKENHRRQGHGEALLKAAIQKCRTRNVHRISLHVDPLRIPAMGLYQKLGFQVDSLIKSYYSPDKDANRMYLDFDSN
ncbi:Prenyl-dependent CAAX protease, putative isoform 1 [Hibiscus syriacus]|uniref:Prenyl-dependent CAAX protease, putative isoform 1 n=1 Tax=Hibiscus syriacus TaxID=106335 RepID=A0A6A2YNS7_HIBSY|nr:putative [ribosomal protein S18]-alanine N-acetyltransferase [Hibiscus syriacus]KAE8680955.1 Prenyl-dependent CAAX protease, putative isoform 1 [Hibiscus syriacus]